MPEGIVSERSIAGLNVLGCSNTKGRGVQLLTSHMVHRLLEIDQKVGAVEAL